MINKIMIQEYQQKTCIFDLTKSTKSAYIYWAGKFPATWLKVGCVYSLIYTPSTGFIKLTMLNDNNDTHTHKLLIHQRRQFS